MNSSEKCRVRIVAAGLSPAWQQILQFDNLRPGEVNRAVESHWCGSGKVLNVGTALSTLRQTLPADGNLAVECRTIAPLGGAQVASIKQDLQSIGVEGRWITTKSTTRVCTTLLDRSSGMTTELVENARALEGAELQEFMRAWIDETAQADVVVLTGSLPPGTPSTTYEEMLKQTSAAAVLDCRGEELLSALSCKPLVVKPNREELAATIGLPTTTTAETFAAMQELNQRGVAWVVVSSGPDAVLVSHADGRYILKPPHVQNVVNPIGSGDCLAAGIAFGIAIGQVPLAAIRLGIAAAVSNVSHLLPARFDVTQLAEIADSIAVEID
ncbi:MAG: PfkB family carbohydrate kinase [Planctomycetota bacterium]|nr:PfkB family carbohydrate kinase [Planctomycetota bacterium]